MLPPLLEISLDSADSAAAAEQGGAHRIELCSALREGGITPSLGLVRQARGACSLPIFTIIRPRGGDFLYSPHEFRTMQEDIRVMAEEGVDGVVFGVLSPEGHVDVERTRELVELSRPMHVTFHRAFDMTCNCEGALEDVIACGADRVLTSGGAPSAWDGRDTLRSLVAQAKSQITVIVGGGVRPANICELIRETGAEEFHSSMRSLVRSSMAYQPHHLKLGEAGADEFARSHVSVEDVQTLVRAATSLSKCSEA